VALSPHHPLVIIVNGEEGLEHGYADRTRDDGVFEYFGEKAKSATWCFSEATTQ
jgi:hypothetical protein